MGSRLAVISVLLAMVGCRSSREPGPAPRAGSVDAGSPPLASPASRSGSAPAGGQNVEVLAPAANAGGVTRFVAIGDTGKGNDLQYAVAAAIKTVCDARGGCGFGLLLGDNFYPTGVQAADDEQFRVKFELPYADLAFPFHPALGNHDYGGNGSGVEFWKGQGEIDYSARSPKWIMPSAYYRFHEGEVDLVALDTNGLVLGFGDKEGQERDVPLWLGASAGPWRVAYGHHPYLSNGPHGNAGAYDHIAADFIPSGGKSMKDFVERHLCGRVDAYLCGHDHSLQDLGVSCGTSFLVSGGGASNTDLPGKNAAEFSAATPGFLLVEATAHRMAFTFFDQHANELHHRELTK